MKRLAPALILLLLSSCAPDRPPWADGRMVKERIPDGEARPDYRDLEARLLAIHNRERAALGIAPLAWDPALATAAARYGTELARLGRLAHSSQASRPGQGENLWMGTAGRYSLERMAGSWAEEKRLFRPGTFPDVSRTGKWSDVAHYTQMVWRRTSRVGCALHRTAEWDYLVCRYSPPGNVVDIRVP